MALLAWYWYCSNSIFAYIYSILLSVIILLCCFSLLKWGPSCTNTACLLPKLSDTAIVTIVRCKVENINNRPTYCNSITFPFFSFFFTNLQCSWMSYTLRAEKTYKSCLFTVTKCDKFASNETAHLHVKIWISTVYWGFVLLKCKNVLFLN